MCAPQFSRSCSFHGAMFELLENAGLHDGLLNAGLQDELLNLYRECRFAGWVLESDLHN